MENMRSCPEERVPELNWKRRIRKEMCELAEAGVAAVRWRCAGKRMVLNKVRRGPGNKVTTESGQATGEGMLLYMIRLTAKCKCILRNEVNVLGVHLEWKECPRVPPAILCVLLPPK